MKKLLAFAVAILMAAPAFAAVQNVKVSGDIDSHYISRKHFSLGYRTTAAPEGEKGLFDQSVFLTQTRLRVDADLSDNVSTTVGMINERAWQVNTSATSGVDLYLAYVTLREFLYSPLTLSVGRQVFHYGNGLILGDGGANNLAGADSGISGIANDFTKATAYDGVKAVLDYKPLTVDLIFFRNDAGSTIPATSGLQTATEDNSDVFGINANYQLGDENNTVAEAYVFSRYNGDLYDGSNKGDKLYVPGLRVSSSLVKGLNASAEVAMQLGQRGTAGGGTNGDNLHRRAVAAQFMASYAIESKDLEKYKPMIGASYTYVSGDHNPGANGVTNSAESARKYTAWDPFNEAQGSGTIYNSIFDLTNMHIISANVSASPIQDVTTQFVWSNLRADKKIDGTNTLTFRSPDGNTVSGGALSGTSEVTGRKDMGNEYDLNTNYAYTEDVTFGLSLGWFVPGKLFTSDNDSTASQALAHVNVNF